MRAHLQEQVRIYGATQLVNLVNQKGHEKPVKEAYERNVKQVSSSSYRALPPYKHIWQLGKYPRGQI